MSNAEEMKEIR